jgi:hypothetical protein
MRLTVVKPNAIDFQFRCTPHDALRFGRRGYAIFFFANYMNDVDSPAIHFRGIDRADGPEKWIEAHVPSGHPDWDHGGTYRAVDSAPLECDSDHQFTLNTWSYDYPRLALPFFYGRAGQGMVFLLMLDRAHTPLDEVRFSVFQFKLPQRPRPAWDLQYVIHRVKAEKEYGFRGRLIWKKWVSPEDCLNEYERWSAEVKSAEWPAERSSVSAAGKRSLPSFWRFGEFSSTESF